MLQVLLVTPEAAQCPPASIFLCIRNSVIKICIQCDLVDLLCTLLHICPGVPYLTKSCHDYWLIKALK